MRGLASQVREGRMAFPWPRAWASPVRRFITRHPAGYIRFRGGHQALGLSLMCLAIIITVAYNAVDFQFRPAAVRGEVTDPACQSQTALHDGASGMCARLNMIKRIVFESGVMTTGRRAPPIPQLQCVSKTCETIADALLPRRVVYVLEERVLDVEKWLRVFSRLIV